MAVRGRRKAQLRGAVLTCSEDDVAAFQAVIGATERVQRRYFADAEAVVCTFTDASKTGWAMIIIQVREWAPGVLVQDHQHELLICKGGMNARLNWFVIEKEAYPIVKACTELECMLDREMVFASIAITRISSRSLRPASTSNSISKESSNAGY
jgi:hypothetical protein